MKKQLIVLAFFLGSLQVLQAQFTLDGEFRPRAEYRHGFGSLFPESAEPGFSINTRARLNAGYKTETYTFYLSMQDVLTWGENRQINSVDTNNSFAIFQAWADIKLGSGFTTKIGRQVLSYDDQRILGGLDWAQMGRNHDAALIRYKKGSLMFDVGLAFNQDFDSNTSDISGYVSTGNEYTEDPNFFTYKAMQYGYLKKEWSTFSASLLVMNNTFQNYELIDGVRTYGGFGVSSLETIGTHLKYNSGAFVLEGNAYLQAGERVNDLSVKSAFLLGLEASYKLTSKVGLGAGIEVVSGNDEDAGETGAFFPLYGTNHKFNGFMDYFYVGNHANSVGLVDVHVSANFTLNETSSLLVKVLNFSGEQELVSGEKSLGTEIDLVYSKKFNGFDLKLGYSQMFASDGMYELKGILKDDATDMQNWAWAMLVLKPKFLNGTK
ncbi:alginate export family protein [uncultured Formosa sp.]|uniref:alginate export family protein n=1 Tax=uncultured Formosa sp. TaxID=255435 RepID=UPI0026287CD0|nr:alginate export family protein [uncultured Formosa sp.]